MADLRAGGYRAVFGGLRTRSAQAGSSVDDLWEIHDRLAAAFAREGNPLGDDQYGAALEKVRGSLNGDVLSGFTAYIGVVQGIRDGLRDGAGHYQGAEDGWGG
ncbi:hypothetical protein OIE66_34345 [Nonomuraea sp. NBC_01738]|uniref:hypothetical protein n=1 Tax=Nonomuraea sp. NBC_01738 TaxID=2976003 RepID=UPI002E0FD983|nr:hypothetical protein OIE66_34345 [Nonomuraea sp. NBC_01738]